VLLGSPIVKYHKCDARGFVAQLRLGDSLGESSALGGRQRCPSPPHQNIAQRTGARTSRALKRCGSLDIWTLKALFNLPLRQATGLVASLLELADLDWPVPDYTTLWRCQKTLPAMLGGRPSSKMRCFKLLGQRIMARTFDRQIPNSKSLPQSSIAFRKSERPI
jgi:hypothetical protein